jgi:hypothetical protein
MSDWSDEMQNPQGLPIVGCPAVAVNEDKRMEVAVRVQGGTVWHIWQTSENNGWSGWDGFGTPDPNFDSKLDPLLALCGDGRLLLFFGPYLKAQVAPNSGWGPWRAWSSANVFDRALAWTIGTNRNGTLEVFVCNLSDRNFPVFHSFQTAPAADSPWSDWALLGTPPVPLPIDVSGFAVGANEDGRLEAFIGYGGDFVYHIWQHVPNANPQSWSQWARLGDFPEVDGLAVGSNQDKRLEVFGTVVGSQGLQHIWQNDPNAALAGWSEWTKFDGPAVANGDPAVGLNSHGRLEVVAGVEDVSGQSILMHVAQERPNGGWLPWDSLGGVEGGWPSYHAMGQNADGRLELFAQVNGRLLHRWQNFDADHSW